MKTLSLQIHYAVGWLLALATLGLVAFKVPPSEAVLGSSYLIVFYHVPSAINCLLFFGLAGLFSIAYLGTGEAKWDRAAVAAVEVGVIGCTITIVTGSIWARAAWGQWWVWKDPRLMTVAIMWFTYLAYLALRSSIDLASQRMRFGAVFGIIASINIILVWFSIRIFTQVSHPMDVQLEPAMKWTMRFGEIAFLVLYSAFCRHRYSVASLKDRSREIEETLALQGA